jgi:hypothetical protein
MTRKALIAKCNRRKLRAARQKANGQKSLSLLVSTLNVSSQVAVEVSSVVSVSLVSSSVNDQQR